MKNNDLWSECVCQKCQKVFIRTKRGISKGQGKYCSRKCKEESCIRIPLVIRFSKYLSEPDKNGCIKWTGCKDKKGYGQIGKGGGYEGHYFAHRVAWELKNGSIPNGLFCCHKCDNPSCVNSEHLFLGTVDDNAKDCVCKGRCHPGEKTFGAKLNEKSVREIKELCKTECQALIAKKFNVSCSTICLIKSGKIWKHIK